MHANERVLIVGEVGLVIIAVVGLFTGQEALAYTATGAFAGLLAGHLNGRQG